MLMKVGQLFVVTNRNRLNNNANGRRLVYNGTHAITTNWMRTCGWLRCRTRAGRSTRHSLILTWGNMARGLIFLPPNKCISRFETYKWTKTKLYKTCVGARFWGSGGKVISGSSLRSRCRNVWFRLKNGATLGFFRRIMNEWTNVESIYLFLQLQHPRQGSGSTWEFFCFYALEQSEKVMSNEFPWLQKSPVGVVRVLLRIKKRA